MSDKLFLEGVVEAYTIGSWRMGTTIKIGGKNLIKEVENTFIGKNGINRGEFEYLIFVEGKQSIRGNGNSILAVEGFCGTDVTPDDPYEIIIGDIDITRTLEGLNGHTVALTIERKE